VLVPRALSGIAISLGSESSGPVWLAPLSLSFAAANRCAGTTLAALNFDSLALSFARSCRRDGTFMTENHLIRHRFLSRLSHWLMAISVLTLLATGLLPVFGIKFTWLTIHWIAGLLLTALVAIHIVRALLFQNPGSMWISVRDIQRGIAALGIGRSGSRPGKYTLPQKLMHHAVALAGLTAIGTGLLMLRKIDTPFWSRDPYFLSEGGWGIVYSLHDLASLTFVTLIILHIYFTLQPGHLFYLRSMLVGWITPEELEAHHDPERWTPPEAK